MIPRHRLLPLAFAAAIVAAPAARAAIQLSCLIEGKQLAFTGMSGAQAVVSDGATTRNLAEFQEAPWSLAFDPIGDARTIDWSPRWKIKRDNGPDRLMRPETPFIARVFIGQWSYLDWHDQLQSGDFNKTWPSESAQGGILVFAWLEDLRATQVHVVPIPQDNLKRFTVRTDFLLSEVAARGRPVIFLWSNGSFVEVTSTLQTQSRADAYFALMRDDVAWLDENASDIPGMTHIAGQMLAAAVQSGCTHAAKWLLALDHTCADWRDGGNYNALHIAAEYGRANLITPLLEAGASLDPPTIKDASTALHLAIRSGHTAVVSKLLEAHADVHVEDRQHRTALGLAIDHGYAALAEMVVDSSDRQLLRGAEMRNVLINQAAQGHSAVVAWLVDKGVSTEEQRSGQSAIIAGARYGDARMLAAILKRGGSIDTKMDNGRTPLMIAATHGNLDYATALIDAGSKLDAVDNTGRSALHFAAANDRVAVVNLLLDRGAPMDARDTGGFSAMEWATRACARKSAAVLAARGSRVLLSGPEALHVLEYAIRLDLADLLRTALRDGWRPETELRPGWPALHLARVSKSTDCIQLLSAVVPEAVGTPVSSVKTLDAPPARIRSGAVDDPRDIDERFPAAQVVVDTIIDADGTPIAPIVRETDAPGLVPSAIAAILETRFAPLSSGGKAAATTLKITVRFPAASERVLLPHEIDEVPRVISLARAKYPDGAPTRGIQAHVELRFTVETDGTVSHLTVARTTGRAFTEEVLKVAKTWRFEPGKRDGKPVAVRLSQVVTFTLNH